MAFNIIAMFFVIAPDQPIPALLPAGGSLPLCDDVATSVVPRSVQGQVFQLKLENIFDNRPFKAYRVILFSLWTVAGHMLGGVIQPANKGYTRVDHHNFCDASGETHWCAYQKGEGGDRSSGTLRQLPSVH